MSSRGGSSSASANGTQSNLYPLGCDCEEDVREIHKRDHCIKMEMIKCGLWSADRVRTLPLTVNSSGEMVL